MAIEESPSAQRRFEAEEETSTTAALAVSQATKENSIDIPPLYGVVDPDSLNRLFSRPTDRNESQQKQLVFRVADCWVHIHGDGRIFVSVGRDSLSQTKPHQGEGHQFSHDWTEPGTLCAGLVRAIEALSSQKEDWNRELLSKPIDLDALSQLFEPISSQRLRNAGWFSFSASGHTVTVTASGEITLSTGTTESETGMCNV